jgi:hypothetical protein
MQTCFIAVIFPFFFLFLRRNRFGMISMCKLTYLSFESFHAIILSFYFWQCRAPDYEMNAYWRRLVRMAWSPSSSGYCTPEKRAPGMRVGGFQGRPGRGEETQVVKFLPSYINHGAAQIFHKQRI